MMIVTATELIIEKYGASFSIILCMDSNIKIVTLASK